MKWNILNSKGKILDILLTNRKIKNKNEFLNPPFPEFKLPLVKAIARIKKAIKNEEKIVVYGDYDADGICATAIMWEALNSLGAKALPFIPQREKEGYGLSIEGIKSLEAKLIIVVDSGIVANAAVDYANKLGIDVIILDHHEKPRKLPKAFAIIHTTELCASGIAYFVARSLVTRTYNLEPFLELATIATITDLMPLTGVNRSIVKYGLEALNKTTRPGLKALFEIAGIEHVGPYEVGYLIGPRLNASGRIESGLSALRLLCTKNADKTRQLATLLNKTNKDRQTMVEEQTQHALQATNYQLKANESLIVISHESYHQGVIGLIAGKLVEKYYRPAIVIAKGETVSKASARSIAGFNIIEAIRAFENLLINAGGHPMAAGFTIETAQIENFKLKIENLARDKISEEMLQKTLRVDCRLDLQAINMNLYDDLARLAPFGIGNPEPVFASQGTIQNLRTVGADGKHLKLAVDGFDAIAFNQGPLAAKLKVGQEISLAYCLALDTFNGNHKLQLKIKDIHYD
ncbi:MAG: single-stranded-DNA-specific exonuclease RecJ [Patescibacteria group bacterium]|nr:single-stranded-DNA-specific exonuclease RecJ [Patescibacteria group bacterium]MCL5431477.1 single-stranded-DNA-specific exonuclease RecJ [Patescibacteria group bacterium]